MIHQDTTLKLSPLTVFVGPNGGGKSAFFDAMLNFSMVSRGLLPQAFGPYPFSYKATLYRGASTVAKIGYRLTMSKKESDSDSLVYEIEYQQSGLAEDAAMFTIINEKLTKHPAGTILFDRSDPDTFPLSKDLPLENDRSLFSALRQKHMANGTVTEDDLVSYCTQHISRFNKFRLDPSVLAAPSRLPEIVEGAVVPFAPRVGYHGEDLASTLYYLADTKAPELELIKEELREIDPEFRDFQFNTIGTDRIAFAIVYADRRQTIPSVRLSAGILIYLGLIVLVMAPNRPPVLMIEEPENGLTPQALKSFYKAARGLALGEKPDMQSQVLISSHSPYVICEAWNGEDRDFIHQVKIVSGRAQVRKFTDIVAAQQIHLGKEKGERTHLSLSVAENVMSGYWS
jgi:predicted ATPase